MEQKNAARERLAQLENKYFQGISLTETALMKTEEERRPFVLAQVERLLNTGRSYCPLAMALSDEFWTSDEGRVDIWSEDPLNGDDVLEVLTHEEILCTALILDIAGLCHDLVFHFVFDPEEAFGIPGEFGVLNKELVEWLSTTPHDRIAMYTAFALKRDANDKYCEIGYLTAQDATAEILAKGSCALILRPEDMEDFGVKMLPRTYVKTILDTLLRIERHWERGQRLKLNPEVVMLHDDIYGFVPPRFNTQVIRAAQLLYDYMDKEVRGRLRAKGKVGSWGDMPESFRNNFDNVSEKVHQKVREVRDQYLGQGWLEDNSLAFSYVLGQAEFIGGYMTSEEDTCNEF